MRIIISLTSYPSRIDGVYKVIESLCRQTVPVDEIVLYLSSEEFPDREDGIPFRLRSLSGKGGFRIEWVGGNLKSHKKYYYALRQYRKDIVITVDDDKIYADTMVSDLIESWRRFPDAISARSVRMIVKKNGALEVYSKWKTRLEQYVDSPRMDLCATGVGGICYPPFVTDDNWFNLDDILHMAENQDDLWLKYNEIINNVPVVYVEPSQNDVTIEGSQTVRLASANLYGGENDKCINDLIGFMRNKRPEKYNDWFQNLMSADEYYHYRFEAMIDSVGAVRIYLYGAGKTALFYLDLLEQLQLTDMISAVVVTDKTVNPLEIRGINIIQFDEIAEEGKIGIIYGVSEANRTEIQYLLRRYDYQFISFNMTEIKKYYSEK
ncbi:MAG: hypothetical protein K2G55_08215 [Lachnospiraceae bacterium]|nr:hypothetical protein [Lachnospiraceae bacterium]MDE7204836.1 hypothetical protein [Lachnospiraceae bacterium]